MSTTNLDGFTDIKNQTDFKNANVCIKAFTKEYEDTTGPTIEKIEGNPLKWTNESVTLRIVGAKDHETGLHELPYSFDGGATWQAENYKTFDENTDGIIIKVRNKEYKEYTSDTINIDKIDKENPTIAILEENDTDLYKAVKYKVSDENSGIKYVSALNFKTEMNGNQKNYEGEYKIYLNGEYTIRVEDQAGNSSELKVQVDNVLVSITSDEYIVEEEYILGILPDTKLEALMQNLNINGEANLEAYNNTDKLNNADQIKTGTIIKIKTSQSERNLILVVRGDITGDGKMNDIDLLKLARYKAKIDTKLEGANLRAADIYEDGKYADDKDLLKMARILVGLDELK